MLFYNGGAGVLLMAYAATGKAGSVVTWSAAVLHLALAAGFGASLLRRCGVSP